ncbi:hypothetical protein BDQ12DRAFT_673739 [Crucibulum laeve]|uniref:C2H2-type domain-containing protein n=1 Tax=Crucibulum laeve TaxID=68775 RepID=A0A5C3MJM4_9AGAR|nr:hypothetical protein BDQ12DRAFT_673739 [Crucibulum laeve]
MQEMHIERESNSGPVRSQKSHVEKRTRASSSPRILSSPRLQAAAILPIPAELIHGTGSDKVMLLPVCRPNPTAKGASFTVRMPDKPAPAAAPLPNLSSSKKKTVAKKLHPCEYDGCLKTFTRRGDVRRHMETASEHKLDVPRGADSATRCRHCNDELSRPDARRRHEERGACGKRTIPRSKAYLESNRLLTNAFRHAE